MNGTLDSLSSLIIYFNDAHLDPNTDVVIAPPSLYIIPLQEHLTCHIEVAAQNAYHEKAGAFTGEISIEQLHDAKIPWVILGHSERRTLFHETSHFVGLKVKAALNQGLSVILCVGESLEEREAGKTFEVVREQLDGVIKETGKDARWDKVVIAYEPVWAIGTGRVASPEQAEEVHRDIRKWLTEELGASVADSTRIIYGGSVSAKNSRELASKPDIDGFLVGGASLKPEFVEVINSRYQPKM